MQTKAIGPMVGGLALAGTLALAGVAQAAPVEQGDLSWGMKESFREYIAGPGGGEITTGDGTIVNPDGTFAFPDPSGTAGEDAADVTFGGWVRFFAHGGALDVTLANPRVEFTGDTGSLFTDITSDTPAPDPPVTQEGVHLAELDLTGIDPEPVGAGLRWSAIPATLSEDGAPAFGGFYAAGTELDPVTLATGEELLVIRGKARARVKRNRTAKVATLVCKAGPCDVKTPRRAAAKIAGKSVKVKVLAPKSVRPGKRKPVKVKLGRAQARALAARQGRVRLKIAGDEYAESIVRTKLKGGR